MNKKDFKKMIKGCYYISKSYSISFDKVLNIINDISFYDTFLMNKSINEQILQIENIIRISKLGEISKTK